MGLIKEIDYKETWPIRQEVMWPNQPLEFIKLEKDPEGIHYGLFHKDQLVSIVSVFILGETAQFRKFATLKNQQSKGYGTQLLKTVFKELEKLNLSTIWCNARKEKIAFYEKFSMKQTGKTFYKKEQEYIKMLWQKPI